MRLLNLPRRELCAWCRRQKHKRRLHQVSRALGITPYAWQRDFVLADDWTSFQRASSSGKTGPGAVIIPRMPMGRRNGKTMAVILRALVCAPHAPENCLMLDPDLYTACDPVYARLRADLLARQYRDAYDACKRAGLMRETHVRTVQLRPYRNRRGERHA